MHLMHCECFSVTQDVLESEQIKLDSMFKFSLMQDIVRVSLFLCEFTTKVGDTYCNWV